MSINLRDLKVGREFYLLVTGSGHVKHGTYNVDEVVRLTRTQNDTMVFKCVAVGDQGNLGD